MVKTRLESTAYVMEIELINPARQKFVTMNETLSASSPDTYIPVQTHIKDAGLYDLQR